MSAPPDDDLTILLPVKDRPIFTTRWMAYAEDQRFPCHVFVADGSTDDRVERALGHSDAYPHVHYQYVRYPPDQTYWGDYWRKIADALSRIATPYVALCDDDDLFVVAGLRTAVAFLRAHPDYATCGGQCAVFWLSGGNGKGATPSYGHRVQWKHSLDNGSLSDPSALQRIRRHSHRTTNPAYYFVRRTDDFRRMVASIRQAGLRDPFLIELLIKFLTAALGKSHQLDTLYLARQWNPSGSAGHSHQATYGDWFGRMLVPSWSADFEAFVDTASGALVDADGITAGEARSSVIALYREWLAPQLLGNLMTEPTVTASMSVGMPLIRRVLDRPAGSPLRRLARAAYRRTRAVSVDALFGVEWTARRVPGADKAFEPVREFLMNPPQ